MSELMKIVSQSMPGASIEAVLDEVRRISIKSVTESVKAKNLKGPMETLEHVVRTYELTPEDTKAVMEQVGHPDVAASPLFEVLYTYLTPNDTPSCMCLRLWRG